MIEGVKIKQLTIHRDVPDGEEVTGKLGILMEIVRADEDLLAKFGQSTMTITYPETIKAFHWHKKQDDLWFVATGKVAVVLHDLREGSATSGETEVMYAGEDDYKVILIPPYVAHGFKVLGEAPVIMFYHTTEPYDPDSPDEERIAYDDPKIGFDWDKIS